MMLTFYSFPVLRGWVSWARADSRLNRGPILNAWMGWGSGRLFAWMAGLVFLTKACQKMDNNLTSQQMRSAERRESMTPGMIRTGQASVLSSAALDGRGVVLYFTMDLRMLLSTRRKFALLADRGRELGFC